MHLRGCVCHSVVAVSDATNIISQPAEFVKPQTPRLLSEAQNTRSACESKTQAYVRVLMYAKLTSLGTNENICAILGLRFARTVPAHVGTLTRTYGERATPA